MLEKLKSNGFFIIPKQINHTINKKLFLSPRERNVVDTILKEMSQRANNKVRIDPNWIARNLDMPQSQFSRIKNNLISRHILCAEQSVRKVRKRIDGKVVYVEEKSKRHNVLFVNLKTSEWIARDNILDRLPVESGIKMRIDDEYQRQNPLFSIAEHDNSLGSFFNLFMQTWAVNKDTVLEYVKKYGIQYLYEIFSELFDKNPDILNDLTAEKAHKLICQYCNSEKGQIIAQQRMLYLNRHQTIMQDHIQFDVLYFNSLFGEKVSGQLLSLMSTHQKRRYNLSNLHDKKSRLMRDLRWLFLTNGRAYFSQNYLNVNKLNEPQQLKHYRPMQIEPMKSEMVHRAEAFECNGYLAPAGDYPVSKWDFDKQNLSYPQADYTYRPIQVFDGVWFKTSSSDLVDRVMSTLEDNTNKVEWINLDGEQQSLLKMDVFFPQYNRHFNPNLRFNAVLPKEDDKEAYLIAHTENLMRLYDYHLISDDDLDIGLQILEYQAKKHYPTQTALSALDYFKKQRAFYSQACNAISLVNYDELTNFEKKDLLVLEPILTAFKHTKYQQYLTNNFDYKLRQALFGDKERHISHIDPISTYIRQFTPVTLEQCVNEPIGEFKLATKINIKELPPHIPKPIDVFNGDLEPPPPF